MEFKPTVEPMEVQDAASAATSVTAASTGPPGSSTAAAAAPTPAGAASQSDDLYEQELADMKLRVANMQAEAAKLAEIRSSMETDLSHAETTAADAAASKADVDARSVYIGNVDYSATPEELHAHFTACGVIHRVTILCDKFTGHPKGFAYVEFADLSAASNALVLNDSLFKGRQIKVTAKRTNVPFMSTRGRGRGFRGGPRGGPRGYRGGSRGFRGRGRGYSPY